MTESLPRPGRPVTSAAATRRLGSDQMAFVRAWAEGLDAAQAWQRYIGQGQAADGRRVRADLQRWLDVLRGVARAQGRPELAALLRRDPEAMADAGGDRISLDDFRAQQPEDFYTEAELLELYEASHGVPDARSGARRRQRLRARQVAALQWLETVAVREPRPDDAVGAWLDERLAARLTRAGLPRLGDLRQRIQARGFHWHRDIPRVGPAAAQRLAQWWQAHARTLGALPLWALTPPGRLDRATLARRPTAAPSGLPAHPVPLERLQPLPARLDGSAGHWRAAADRLSIAAANDRQALAAWLGLRTPGSATWRAYRKEAERLMLWALWVAGKPVSSLDAADLRAYEAFLLAPPEGWTAPRGTPRWHDDWRPFEGPLAARSRTLALGILRGLFAWWVAQGYLAVNSWTLELEASHGAGQDPAGCPCAMSLAEPSSQGAGQSARRVAGRPAASDGLDGLPRGLTADLRLTMQQWLADGMARQGRTPAGLRLRALCGLAMDAGLRPAELIAARLDWLLGGDAEAAAVGMPCSLQVPATPGRRGRVVPLSEDAVKSLREYLACRPLVGAPRTAQPAAPLFAHLRAERPLSAARLYEVLSQAFTGCADEMSSFKPLAADRLRRASTIWLRHGFGLRAAAEGVPTAALQQQMGHRSRSSTASYRRMARAMPLTEPGNA